MNHQTVYIYLIEWVQIRYVRKLQYLHYQKGKLGKATHHLISNRYGHPLPCLAAETAPILRCAILLLLLRCSVTAEQRTSFQRFLQSSYLETWSSD